MKRQYILISLIFLTLTSVGQSLRILHDKEDVTNKIITIPIAVGQQVETDFSIFNSTENAISYQVNRTILNPPLNDVCAQLYFCAGKLCYLPSSDITWTAKGAPTNIPAHGTMPNGSGTFGIFAHYNVCSTVCNDLYVHYRVYNTAVNTTDTAYVDIRYTCSNGIQEYIKARTFLSDAFPNPAGTSFSLAYDLNNYSKGEILIHDIVGKEIQRVELADKQGTIKIGTANLTAGIYFYSLVVNGFKTCTKELVVVQNQ